MAHITFIGLGHMGRPMARNLLKAGHRVTGFDVLPTSRNAFREEGGSVAENLRDALEGVDIVISMVNARRHVQAVYEGDEGVIARAPRTALLIDCSTIDVATARSVSRAAGAAGFEMLDAPVSGGTNGADAGTLTFMVGGTKSAYDKAADVLAAMGKKIVYAGPHGNGQAAKICNNMMLGISLIGVSEGFQLGKKLGLDYQTLFDIASASSGQSWAMTQYCPVPGPVPTSPSSKNYEPGFSAALLLKDLRLSQDAAASVGPSTPLGAQAAALYQIPVDNGFSHKDCSIVAQWLVGQRADR